jgi:N-acetylglucosamine kinase-like BadF-type ATPase
LEKYVIGLDGGGTKTTAVVWNLDEKELLRFSVGPINPNGNSADLIKASVREIFSRIDEAFGLSNCHAACLGAAGISNPGVKVLLEQEIRNSGFTAPFQITGDQKAALCGALGTPIGAILISGTGSICYGVNVRGEEHRTGGFGYLIDDVGSGYAIGREILSAVVRASDGRQDSTILTEFLLKEIQGDTMEDVVRYVYDVHTGKRGIASLARFLPEACSKGDGTALSIVKRCGEDLLSLSVPVMEKLDLQEGSLALAGSILQKDPWIKKSFLNCFAVRYPKAECVSPLRDAAAGAAQLALEWIGGAVK